MKRWMFLVFLLPLTVHASVAEDINALLDRFFGGDQTPVEETESWPDVSDIPVETIDAALDGVDLESIRAEILQQEAELEAFESSLRAQRGQAQSLQSDRLSQQQQLALVDEQIELNRRKLDFYQAQHLQWQALVTQLTREKSALRAEMRILEREYQDLLSKNFIQKQNFQLNPTVNWWQWLFSEKPVSKLLEERRSMSTEQGSKGAALARMQQLKNAFDAQEMEAVKALAQVSDLQSQLAKEQIVLNDLAEAKATLVSRLTEAQSAADQRVSAAQSAQIETTAYLQDLRQQLLAAEAAAQAAQVEAEVVQSVGLPTEFLSWPVPEPVLLNAGFKDEAYLAEYEREHLGLDFAVDQGTDVMAAAEGVISKVETDSTGYTYVIVQHEPDLFTVYGHLSKVLVEADQPVLRGEVIAWSGGTPGTSGAGYFTSGPHLHFEVFSGGTHIDPLMLLPEILD